MLKNNKIRLIISSIVILLPMLAGGILWNVLPDNMQVHWYGDGYSKKAFAVFALPLILLALHWLCILITAHDPKNKGQNRKVFYMVLWIIPVISIFVNCMIYMAALGGKIENVTFFVFIVIGLAFILIGNYLPKCKQNYTIGVKIKWTLASEENWNATHRLTGKVWVAGGLVILFGCFLPLPVAITLMTVVLVIMVALPMIYSWRYYKKQVAEGSVPEKTEITHPWGKNNKKTGIITLVAIVVIVVVLIVVCFTGSIEIEYKDTEFVVETSYNDDIVVKYAEIDEIEFRESFDKGVRLFGFGSPTLSVGSFENSEFGKYTISAYTPCDAAVVIRSGEKILVLNLSDEASTKELYEEILARVNEAKE